MRPGQRETKRERQRGTRGRNLALSPHQLSRQNTAPRPPPAQQRRALHLHAVLRHPQVVRQAGDVAPHRVARRVVEPAGDEVEHLVDGADVHVPRVLVLVPDVLHHLAQRPGAQPGAAQQRLGPAVQRPPHGVLHPGVRVVQVRLAAAAARRVPVHTPVVGAVQLAAQRVGDGGGGRRGAAPVQVAHRQVHHAAVAPHAARVERQRVGQGPCLRRDGVQAGPFSNKKMGENESGADVTCEGSGRPHHFTLNSIHPARTSRRRRARRARTCPRTGRPWRPRANGSSPARPRTQPPPPARPAGAG